MTHFFIMSLIIKHCLLFCLLTIILHFNIYSQNVFLPDRVKIIVEDEIKEWDSVFSQFDTTLVYLKCISAENEIHDVLIVEYGLEKNYCESLSEMDTQKSVKVFVNNHFDVELYIKNTNVQKIRWKFLRINENDCSYYIWHDSLNPRGVKKCRNEEVINDYSFQKETFYYIDTMNNLTRVNNDNYNDLHNNDVIQRMTINNIEINAIKVEAGFELQFKKGVSCQKWTISGEDLVIERMDAVSFKVTIFTYKPNHMILYFYTDSEEKIHFTTEEIIFSFSENRFRWTPTLCVSVRDNLKPWIIKSIEGDKDLITLY